MSESFSLLGTLAVLGIFLSTGCGEGSDKDIASASDTTAKVQLQRVVSPSAETLLLPLLQTANPIPVNSSLTIESLKTPLLSITLEGGGGKVAPLYTCTGECLVELTGNALTSLISAESVPIDPGIYEIIAISNCESGSYEAQLTASGTLDGNNTTGTTYYTQAGSGELTTDIAQKGAATVYFNGCRSEYRLATPIKIDGSAPIEPEATESDGTNVVQTSSLNLNLYFDLEGIAAFGDASNPQAEKATTAGGATFPYDPSGAGVTTTFAVVNYPDIMATATTGTPIAEHYRVSATTGQGVETGTIGLFFNADGTYFGGYTRSYFGTETTTGLNTFVTPLVLYRDNGDSTYKISNVSKEDADGGVVIEAFSRATHSNDCRVKGASVSCQITKL